MPENNPYQPPNPQADEVARPLRIGNYNRDGGRLAAALVIGPLLLGWIIFLVATGRLRDEQGQANPTLGIVLIVIGSLIQLAALVYAFTVPVIWLEIGRTLRYATLLRAFQVNWGDVQRIWFEREDTKVRPLPFVSLNLATHFVLGIRVSEHRDLRVFVPTERMPLVAAIMELHPKFKDTPYDDQPVADSSNEELWDEESDPAAWNKDDDE